MYYQRRLLTYFFSFFFIVCVEKITDKTRRRHTKETERKEGARKRNDKYIHTHTHNNFLLFIFEKSQVYFYIHLLVKLQWTLFFVHNSNTHQFIYYRFFFLVKKRQKHVRIHTHTSRIEEQKEHRTKEKQFICLNHVV
jgi:hypothetical protein